jgi:hypothetical protein
MARITREASGFSAQVITFVAIYSCTSLRDPQLEQALGQAFSTRALLKMKSARLDPHEPADACLLHGSGVCLSTVELNPRAVA